MTGQIRVPGDKSISHRALMIGGLAVGETVIEGLLEGEDVLATAAAMRAFGCSVERHANGLWRIWGRGVGGLGEPDSMLDLGNAGTATRLLMGVAAGHPFTSFFTGDASLRRRPMARVTGPLIDMGAGIVSRSGGRLPLAITGRDDLLPIEYRLPVASAQVKSAILLAGLHAAGTTIVIEPEPTRDHTENMLRQFGATIQTEILPDGGRIVRLTGQPELTAQAIRVPSDISSAAFPLVAAAIIPGSNVTCEGVGLNPLRAGIIETLIEMDADLTIANRRIEAGEPVGDVTVKYRPLKPVTVPASRAPSMIDEYPILAVAAAFANGVTHMAGLAELRVKESDRLMTIAQGLAGAGIEVAVTEDSLTVTGSAQPPAGGAEIASRLDHRIAMAFLVLGLATDQPMTIDQAATIDTSFPGFVATMTGLGAEIAPCQ